MAMKSEKYSIEDRSKFPHHYPMCGKFVVWKIPPYPFPRTLVGSFPTRMEAENDVQKRIFKEQS